MENEEILIEDYLQMILITNMRIYDALLLLLLKEDKEIAIKMQQEHAKMENFGPNPWKSIPDGEEEK